jgi:hypothetical protein
MQEPPPRDWIAILIEDVLIPFAASVTIIVLIMLVARVIGG